MMSTATTFIFESLLVKMLFIFSSCLRCIFYIRFKFSKHICSKMAKPSFVGGLVGVAYLPHGTMILDPTRRDLPLGAESLHSVCMNISKNIAALNPDLVILCTPHGINLHQAINVYQPGVENCRASGNAQWNDQWTEYSVDVGLDGEASQQIYLHLKQKMQRVEGMRAFAGLSVPLRWGEVVPLYFALHQLALSKNQANISSPLKAITVQSESKVVIIGQPMKGTTEEEINSYRQEQPAILIEFGRSLRSWCESQKSRRILLVISGDQAHTHSWSSDLPKIYQPDPLHVSNFPQSGTVCAKQFDEIIINWMTGNCLNSANKLFRLDEKLVIDEAGKIEKVALSCGYTGSLTMQGVMGKDLIENQIGDQSKSIDKSADWLLTDFISCHPSYYGMAAALYVRNYLS